MSDITQDLSDITFDHPLEEEVESLELDSTQRTLFTSQADPEIESLHNKFKRGRLVVQPDFQRQYVWDAAKASRLIESALLDIPLPVIYISEEKDGTEYVIDGQQRLTSFFAFIDGKFPDGRDFRLSGLKVFNELNRKTFKDLDEKLQDQIRYYHVRTITFKKESQTELKFEVFERLNTGSVSLNDQELRNCIYRGSFIALLKELSRDPDFIWLMGLQHPDKRMKDVELVLRFAAFREVTYLNYRPPMKRFLNTIAESRRNIPPEQADQLRRDFKNAVMIIRSLLGGNAFKRYHRGNEKNPDGHWEPKQFNASLYDILMFSFARADRNRVFNRLDTIREALIELMSNDQEFIEAIELSTSSVQAVTKRFDKWRNVLEGIIGVGEREPRTFPIELKRQMFAVDPTCGICHQQILDVDDAALDHLHQYAHGGATLPENARLTHRYCNWARPRNETVPV